MARRLAALVALTLFVTPAFAIFDRPIALQGILDKIPVIFVAEVDKVDADKATAVFVPTADLKGKAGFERLPVNLKDGVTEAGKKAEHTKVILDRLAKGRKLILFVKKENTDYSAYGFVEGTWFQLSGTTDPDGKTVRWAFLNCEPAFRGTFKGSTEELRALAVDVLAGKAKAPPPDAKEKPGFGPTVDDEKKDKKEEQAGVGGPLFGVIPSTVFVAPLAVLAALFPATFAGLASGFQRWRAFLMVVSVNGTLAAVYFFTRKYLANSWWASPTAFTAFLLGVVALGLVWSGRRYRVAAADPAVTDPPTRRDILAVFGFALASVGVVLGVAAVTNWFTAGSPFMRLDELVKLMFELPTRELTAAIVGLLAATLYLTYRMGTRRIDPPQPVHLSAPGESVALGAMLLFGTVSLVNAFPRTTASAAAVEGGDTAVSPTEAKLKLTDAGVWYEAADVEEAYSALSFSKDAAYFGGVKDSLFRKGAIVCLDRATGKQRWVYTDRELKTVYCTPTEANGRVFCGEGLHTDPACRLLALDAATGTKVWDLRTTSHTEGTPVVADGKVYFSAGDDGLYCVTADGAEVWRYRGREQRLHVDTPVAVANGRVYAGSGYQTLAAFCLNADTGEQLWKTEFPLRSFGPPLVVGKRVYYGLGTGNLSFDLSHEPEPGRPPETVAAGAVVCLDAATGEQAWKHDLTHSVHTQLSADGRALYAACRDGWVYALDLADGKRLWRFNYGVPLSTGTATAAYTRFGFPVAVYVVTPDGRVSAHDPATGKVVWSRSIPDITGRDAEAMAAPTVVKADPDGVERQVYVTVTLTNRNNGAKAAAVVRFVDRAVE